MSSNLVFFYYSMFGKKCAQYSLITILVIELGQSEELIHFSKKKKKKISEISKSL